MEKKYILSCTSMLQQENTHKLYISEEAATIGFNKAVEKAKAGDDIAEVYTEEEWEFYYETKSGSYRIYIEELYTEEFTKATLKHVVLRSEVLKERILLRENSAGGRLSEHQLSTKALLKSLVDDLEKVFYYKPEYVPEDQAVFETEDEKTIILHLADVIVPRIVNRYKEEEDGK